MTSSKPTKRYLGIDYGQTIGLAFGVAGLANPLASVNAKDIEAAIYEINRYLVENQIDELVIGLPLGPDHQSTPQSLEVKKFAKRLKIRTRRPITFHDESFTSREALEVAIETGIPRKKRRDLHALAATLILQSYLDSQLPS